MFTAAGGDLTNNLPETKAMIDGEGTSSTGIESLTSNVLNSINRTSLITFSQFSDFWRSMCQANHDEASQFFYVVTKAADIASNFSSANDTLTTDDSTDHSSSNTFSYLSKTSSDLPNLNQSTSGHQQNLNLNSSSFNSNMNNKKVSSAMRNQQPTSSGRRYIVPEDLVILIQDVVDSHPGLGFLKEATEFHSRYVHTVSFGHYLNLVRKFIV